MIFFNVPKPKEYLLKNKSVFTLRKWRKSDHEDVAATGNYWKPSTIQVLGKVHVKFIEEVVSSKQLIPYYKNSGMDDPSEWFKLARKLHSQDILYLYEVILIGDKD